MTGLPCCHASPSCSACDIPGQLLCCSFEGGSCNSGQDDIYVHAQSGLRKGWSLMIDYALMPTVPQPLLHGLTYSVLGCPLQKKGCNSLPTRNEQCSGPPSLTPFMHATESYHKLLVADASIGYGLLKEISSDCFGFGPRISLPFVPPVMHAVTGGGTLKDQQHLKSQWTALQLSTDVWQNMQESDQALRIKLH